jgi:hypothetical protein
VDDPSSPFFTTTPATLPTGDVWPFNQPIFILLNEAVGGTLGGSITNLTNPGAVDSRLRSLVLGAMKRMGSRSFWHFPHFSAGSYRWKRGREIENMGSQI